MRTSTEFVIEISTPTIHIFIRFSCFRFSDKGEVDVYRTCVCVCFIVSIPMHEVDACKDRF